MPVKQIVEREYECRGCGMHETTKQLMHDIYHMPEGWYYASVALWLPGQSDQSPKTVFSIKNEVFCKACSNLLRELVNHEEKK